MSDTTARPGYDPGTLLLLQEAADLAGCSVDRIKRARRAGAFPGARTRDGDGRGTWLIPITDLIQADLVPVGVLATASETIAAARETRQVATLLEDNHQQAARIAALQAEITRLEAERDWLRAFLLTSAKAA